MAMTCENIGPELGAPRAICTNYTLCILNRLGEPPAGAYFWTQRMELGFGVSFCFDDAAPGHREYARGVARVAPDTWTPGLAL